MQCGPNEYLVSASVQLLESRERGKGGEEEEGKRRRYRNNAWVILYNTSSSLIISIMISHMKTKVENNKYFILSVTDNN